MQVHLLRDVGKNEWFHGLWAEFKKVLLDLNDLGCDSQKGVMAGL